MSHKVFKTLNHSSFHMNKATNIWQNSDKRNDTHLACGRIPEALFVDGLVATGNVRRPWRNAVQMFARFVNDYQLQIHIITLSVGYYKVHMAASKRLPKLSILQIIDSSRDFFRMPSQWEDYCIVHVLHRHTMCVCAAYVVAWHGLCK